MPDNDCAYSRWLKWMELQVAPFVSLCEVEWWRTNELSRYNTGSIVTLDHLADARFLRSNPHISFDKSCVALVSTPVTHGSLRLAVRLNEYPPEHEHLDHNGKLHPTAIGVHVLRMYFTRSVTQHARFLLFPADLGDRSAALGTASWQ